MPNPQQTNSPSSLTQALARVGLRFTRQREEVFHALVSDRSHPTAGEVYQSVKRRMPTISLATVYNCLETLAESGLIRQVNFERSPSRYCPNLENHGHFYCDDCGRVIDVPLPELERMTREWHLPAHCVVMHHEVALRGLCPECAHGNGTNRKP